MSFRDVKVGDTVHRLLAGLIPMNLPVEKVTEDLIICVGGWEFDRDTGVEVDDMIPMQVSHLVKE